MFIGEYKHSIDTKKRLAVPSKYRKDLGETVVITRGLDKCLFVYSLKTWKQIAKKLGSLPMGEAGTRSFIRLMLAGASDVDLDSQGRVLIPNHLKEYADLTKNVIITGLYDRLEIWDQKAWDNYKNSAEENSTEIAEQLGKLGIY